MSKFRIWDKKYKEWRDTEQENLYINQDGKVYEIGAGSSSCGDVWLDTEDISKDVEVNWFTGLLDINEKKIFQGDIINYHRHVGAYYESKVVYKTGVVV